jgi:ADP-ribose pyrophosphatase YjhB (NUDIX family)
MYAFRYCPDCGSPLAPPETPTERLTAQVCDACAAVHFRNAKPCAGALVTRDRQVLLGRRAIEPGKGMWDIPGGFLEPWEHPADAAIREVAEETGLRVLTTKLLTVVMDTYQDQFYTLNVYYLADIVDGQPCAADDLEELRWFTPASLPADFAFAHCRRVLEAWIATL